MIEDKNYEWILEGLVEDIVYLKNEIERLIEQHRDVSVQILNINEKLEELEKDVNNL